MASALAAELRASAVNTTPLRYTRSAGPPACSAANAGAATSNRAAIRAGRPMPSRPVVELSLSIEVDSERRVPEGPIDPEGTAIARIHLTVRQAAHDREHRIGR